MAKLKVGQVVTLGFLLNDEKGHRSKILERSKWKVKGIYPHCTLFTKLVKGEEQEWNRICPGRFDLKLMITLGSSKQKGV